MFKPLQMMITKTMNPSMSTSRGTHSTVDRDDDDDDSSSPGFNYSSPESDDDDHIVSKVVENESKKEEQKASGAKNSRKKNTTYKDINKSRQSAKNDSPSTSHPSPLTMGKQITQTKKPAASKSNTKEKGYSSESLCKKKGSQTDPKNKIVSTTPATDEGTLIITAADAATTTTTAGALNEQQAEKGTVTPTPAKKKLPKKKRLTQFEQLEDETHIAGETIKAVTDELLKYKRAAYKVLMKDIKEKEDDLKGLKESAQKAEKEINEAIEKKKGASKHARDLKNRCAKVIEKAVEEKNRSKAKDVELKALKKRKELEGRNVACKEENASNKKRKVASSGKKKKKRSSAKDDCSDEEDSCNTDENDGSNRESEPDDDPDWEGAARRHKKSSDGIIHTPSSSTRKTRVRCTKWECQNCTLINDGANKECVVCEHPKPGNLPKLE